MSWSFTVVGKNKDEAKQKVQKWRERYNCLPGHVESAILNMIEAMPQETDQRIFVRSHGHIDQHKTGRHGQVTIEVSTTTSQEL